METKSQMVVSGGGENGELVLNGCRVLVGEDRKVGGMDGGDGCTTMGMYRTPLI